MFFRKTTKNSDYIEVRSSTVDLAETSNDFRISRGSRKAVKTPLSYPPPPNDVSVHSDSRLVGGPDISKDSDGVSSSSSGRAQLSEAPGGEAHGKCAASS